jgi:hypothetical protein
VAIRLRRTRSQTVRKFRLHKQEWVDPHPWIPGTKPEKILFAGLVKRGIYFRYQDDFPIEDRYISGILQDRNFKPDFIVPEWKIIFDPYGDFVHSRPEAIGTKERPGPDAWKEVYYRSKGYEFIHPWSSQVEAFGADWFISLSERLKHPPMFKLGREDLLHKAARGYKLGPNLGLGANAVAAANHARAKPKSLTLRVGQRRRNIRRTR